MCKMQDTKVENAGCKMQDAKCRMQDAKCRMQKCKMQCGEVAKRLGWLAGLGGKLLVIFICIKDTFKGAAPR